MDGLNIITDFAKSFTPGTLSKENQKLCLCASAVLAVTAVACAAFGSLSSAFIAGGFAGSLFLAGLLASEGIAVLTGIALLGLCVASLMFIPVEPIHIIL